MNIPYIMKKCTKCGEWKVASTVNFHKGKKGKYGLIAECKECKNNKSRNKKNPVNTDESITQICTTCGRKFPATVEYFHRAKSGKYGLRGECKECAKKNDKQYYRGNKNKIAERNKQWRLDNKDKRAEYDKQWRQTPAGRASRFNERQKRRIKEEEQGTGITKDQWLELMSFFNWKCAYSGEYLGGSNNSFNRTIDHIVPINSGGDNMVWNMVPMTRSLNSSKHDKDMLEWYKEQDFYSEARLEKIYKWQEYAYNKWGKDSEYFNTNDIQIKLI